MLHASGDQGERPGRREQPADRVSGIARHVRAPMEEHARRRRGEQPTVLRDGPFGRNELDSSVITVSIAATP